MPYSGHLRWSKIGWNTIEKLVVDRFVVDALPLDQHRELVTAEPRDEIVGAQAMPQALGSGLQQLVAGAVAETVVDRLEAVEVEEHHGEAVGRLALVSRHRAFELAEEVAAIGQVGKAIVIRDVLELFHVSCCRGTLNGASGLPYFSATEEPISSVLAAK